MRSKDAGQEAGPPSAAGGELQTWLEKIAATVPGVICSFRLRPDGAISMPFATAALDAISQASDRGCRLWISRQVIREYLATMTRYEPLWNDVSRTALTSFPGLWHTRG